MFIKKLFSTCLNNNINNPRQLIRNLAKIILQLYKVTLFLQVHYPGVINKFRKFCHLFTEHNKMFLLNVISTESIKNNFLNVTPLFND